MISQKQLAKNIRRERKLQKVNKDLQNSGIILSGSFIDMSNPSEKEIKSIDNRMKRQKKRGFYAH